jgi:hypothetical protein
MKTVAPSAQQRLHRLPERGIDRSPHDLRRSSYSGKPPFQRGGSLSYEHRASVGRPKPSGPECPHPGSFAGTIDEVEGYLGIRGLGGRDRQGIARMKPQRCGIDQHPTLGGRGKCGPARQGPLLERFPTLGVA